MFSISIKIHALSLSWFSLLSSVYDVLPVRTLSLHSVIYKVWSYDKGEEIMNSVCLAIKSVLVADTLIKPSSDLGAQSL